MEFLFKLKFRKRYLKSSLHGLLIFIQDLNINMGSSRINIRIWKID